MASDKSNKLPREQEEHLRQPFEDGAPSMIDGQSPGPAPLDENAGHGPGGDSRPDPTDPSTAQFDRVDDDPRFTSTRENHEPPRREQKGVEEELDTQRETGGETGGMGREGTPRETPTQGGWQRPHRVPRHEELSDDKPS